MTDIRILSTKVSTKEFVTPLGQLLGAATEEGVIFLGFAESLTLGFDLRKTMELLEGTFADPAASGNNPHLPVLEKQLKEYIAKKRKLFSVPLVLTGTDFQKTVWKGLRAIPYGEKWSYTRQADYIGRPKAVRAVGSANGKNKLPIIIPCHRVIAKDGSSGGYTGGLWRKEFLLKLEA